jgi:organic radical activating enzyme
MPQSTYEVRDGKIQSLVCEINVAEHCNLSCRACSHLSPVLPRHLVEPDDVERDLSRLGEHYHARSIRLLGGEPLLHPRLLDVIAAARRSGVADGVCVVTNGVLLPRMPAEFWRAVTTVEVSLYPGKELTAPEQDACSERAAAAGVSLKLRRVDEFRESYSELGTRDRGLVQQIYDSCILRRNHTVAGGYFYRCPPSYFIPKLMTLDDVHDGLRIEQDAGFGARLLRFLESSEPLGSCRNCLGSAGIRFPHGQTLRAEFRGRQQRPTEELLDRRYLLSRRSTWLRSLSRGR